MASNRSIGTTSGLQSPICPKLAKIEIANKRVNVVDMRSKTDFISEHIENSIFGNLDKTVDADKQQEKVLSLSYLISKRKAIQQVTHKGDEELAYQLLALHGFLMIVGFLDGGIEAWKQSGFPVVGTDISPVDALSSSKFTNNEKNIFQDIRSEDEWSNNGVLSFAKQVEIKNLTRSSYVPQNSNVTESTTKLESIHPSANTHECTYYIYSNRMRRAQMVFSYLKFLDVKNVFVVDSSGVEAKLNFDNNSYRVIRTEKDQELQKVELAPRPPYETFFLFFKILSNLFAIQSKITYENLKIRTKIFFDKKKFDIITLKK